MAAISKFLRDLRDPLDLSLQMLATEMDISAKNLKYLNSELCFDGITRERFDKLIRDIVEEEIAEAVLSLDDNTTIYEIDTTVVALHSMFGVTWLLFDSASTLKIENLLGSY